MKLTNEKIKELDTLVLKLSKRLSNVSYVEDVLKKSGLEYKEYSLAVSYPALCILFSELQAHFPEEKFELVAHKYLEKINNSFETKGVDDISLFDGLSGVGYAAECMSQNGKFYQRFIAGLNEKIIERVEQNITEYRKNPVNELFYDIMYGITGIGNYLLNFPYKEEIKDTLHSIVLYIMELCDPNYIDTPKFTIDPHDSPLFTAIRNKEKKYVNLGISHGVPGMLLLLIKTYEAGIVVPKQLDTIKFVASYISNCCIKREKEIFWESQKIVGTSNIDAIAARDAWCYGTPGVSYSLLRASKILKDEEMFHLAVNSMKLSIKERREIISPTFCHGLSGLCCLARKYYEYTSDSYFYDEYMKLLGDIVNLYNEDAPFGFKDKEIKRGIIVSEDEIGLLTGVSGVILTILSCYKPVATKWDSIFLL